jgi:hypothetical protein
MQRVYVLPQDLRSVLSREGGSGTGRFLLRFARVGHEAVFAFREVGKATTMISAIGDRSDDVPVSPRVADAWVPLLAHSLPGTVASIAVMDASGGAHHAEAFLPGDAGVPATIEVRFDTAGERGGFEPPAWLAACREVDGAERLLALLADPPAPAGRSAVAGLRAMLDRGLQTSLGMQLLVSMPDPNEGLSRWEIIHDEARRLGMVLSVDAASVRTALAQFADRGDVAGILAEADGRRTEIILGDGLFVLRRADGPLGVVPWEEAHGLPRGTVVLGPDAARPAILHGPEAMALARDGLDPAAGIGLWSRDDLDGISVVLCGTHPDAMPAPVPPRQPPGP